MKESLKYSLGLLLATLLPSRRRIIREEFTLPYWNPQVDNNRVDRLIRLALAKRVSVPGRQTELEDFHRNFWKRHPSSGWFAASRDRNQFSAHTDQMVARICQLCEARQIRDVVEIGTGDGSFLGFLRSRLGTGLNYTGIDICNDQIQVNRRNNPTIQFVAADACQWMTANPRNNCLYLTHGGVLEYFSQKSVETLLDTIARHCPPSVVALLVEPLAMDHDLDGDIDSRPFGKEFSFSHNYPALLEARGLQIHSREEIGRPRERRISLIALTSG